jgi:hypothetical protein
MGGLFARYFLEVLGGRELTSKLITIGTPYQGSINALNALVNGLFLGLGPIGFSVDKLVRSFPSVYEFMPTYKCLDFGDGQWRDLHGSDLPNRQRSRTGIIDNLHHKGIRRGCRPDYLSPGSP